MQIKLESFDIRRIKDIAVMEGRDPETFTDNDFWAIVSESLIRTQLELKSREKRQMRSSIDE